MSLYSPYNDDRIIECVCDCSYKTTKDGKHLNCMTTGKRWNRQMKGKDALATVDYCPCGAEPKWRFISTQYCDNCNEPFHDVIAWWNDPAVMEYFHRLIGITRKEQLEHTELDICPDCYKKIRESMLEDGYVEPLFVEEDADE